MATVIDLGKVMVTPEGEYSASKQYHFLSLVSFQGSAYVAKQDVIGILPTNSSYWMIHGRAGNDGQDAYQPFKGWYASADDLSASVPSPRVGDYAYVMGVVSTDPVLVHECTTAGSWDATTKEFNPANNQEFASGQALNTVRIVNDLTSGGTANVLSAEQGKQLKSMLNYAIDEVSVDQGYTDRVVIDTTLAGGGGNTQPIMAASPTMAGMMSATDKSKLESHEQNIAALSGLPLKWNSTTARLLAAVVRKMAFVDTSAQDSADQLISILEQAAALSGITATYTGPQRFTGDSISVSDFAVTANYSDGTSESVTATSVSPSRLTSTSTQVTVTYNGKTTVVTVPATFNAVVGISDISSAQTDATEGESVDLSAISYTLTYANGNSVEMSDPNIITASPTTLVEGTNTITIALADYPSISGTLTINAGGAVTSAYVEKTFTNAANTSSGLLTFPSPMTVTPVSIVITNPTTAGSAAARLRGATLTYNSQTDTWEGTAYNGSSPDSNPRTLTAANVTLSGDAGNWTGVTIGDLQCVISGSTYTLQFRGDYTFTFTSETSAP